MSDRQIFVGNLCNVTIEALRLHCEQYGQLIELSLNRDKENNVYHCFAFVTFQSTSSVSKFMSDRPHILCGGEVFVKRALPRLMSSIPERLIVTNRLILQDASHFDAHAVRHHFRKFGHIKKIDLEQGFIDFEDYDDVDCILLARPHYIRDKEIFVTKYAPLDNNSLHSNQYRSNSYSNHSHLNTNGNKQPSRIFQSSRDSTEFPCISKIEKTVPETVHVLLDRQHEDNEERNNGNDSQHLNVRLARLEGQFEEYKKTKECELYALKMDLERTRQQIADSTQEKLDNLLKNQKRFYDEIMRRLNSNEPQTSEGIFRSSPNNAAKKRKLLISSPIPCATNEYEFYS